MVRAFSRSVSAPPVICVAVVFTMPSVGINFVGLESAQSPNGSLWAAGRARRDQLHTPSFQFGSSVPGPVLCRGKICYDDSERVGLVLDQLCDTALSAEFVR